jgi:hypothetical protein
VPLETPLREALKGLPRHPFEMVADPRLPPSGPLGGPFFLFALSPSRLSRWRTLPRPGTRSTKWAALPPASSSFPCRSQASNKIMSITVGLLIHWLSK